MRILLVLVKRLLALFILETSVLIITGFIAQTRFRSNNKRETYLSVSKFNFGKSPRDYMANGVPSAAGRKDEERNMEEVLEERLATIAQMERDIEQRLISLSQKERALQQQQERRPGPGGPRGSTVSNEYTIGKHLEIFGSQTSDKNTLDVGAIRDENYYNPKAYERSQLTESKLYSPLGNTESPFKSSSTGTTSIRIGPSSDERSNEASMQSSSTVSPQENDYTKAVLATIAVGLGSALAFGAANQNNAPSEQWKSFGGISNNWMESMRPASSRIEDRDSIPLESATTKLMEKLNTGASPESGIVKDTPKEQTGKTEGSEKSDLDLKQGVEKEPAAGSAAPRADAVDKPVREVPNLVFDTNAAPKSSELGKNEETSGLSKSADSALQTKVESPITTKLPNEAPAISKLSEESGKPKADESIITALSKNIESAAITKSSDETVKTKTDTPVSDQSSEDAVKAKFDAAIVTKEVDAPVSSRSSEDAMKAKFDAAVVTKEVDAPVSSQSSEDAMKAKFDAAAVTKEVDAPVSSQSSEDAMKAKSENLITSKASDETVMPKVESLVKKSLDEVEVIKTDTSATPKSSDILSKEGPSDAALKPQPASTAETTKILGKVEEVTENKVSPPKVAETTVKPEAAIIPDQIKITDEPVPQPTGTVASRETFTVVEPKSTATTAAVDAAPKDTVAETAPEGSKDPSTVKEQTKSMVDSKASVTGPIASTAESSVSNVMKTEDSGTKAIPTSKTSQEELLKEAAVNTFMKALVSGDVSVESAAKVEDAIEAFLKSREAARRSVVAANPVTIKTTLTESGASSIPVDTVVNTILEQLRAGVTLEIRAKAPDSRSLS